MSNKKNFQAIWNVAIKSAKQNPGIWVTLERGRSNANRVSEFRSGRFPFLPPDEFVMRSYQTPLVGDVDSKKNAYNIEIMALPTTTQEVAVDRKFIRDEVRRRLEPMFESIIDEMVDTIERRTQT